MIRKIKITVDDPYRAPSGTSRNDGWGSRTTSRRPDPVAVKSVGHPVRKLHQRDRTRFDVGRVENRKVTAVFGRAPDHGQQPAIALGGIIAAGDEHRLGDGVTGGQEISA